MKKILGLLTVLVMILSYNPFAAAQTAAQNDFHLEGIILEKTQDGDYLLNTLTMGEVLVKVDKNTLFEGLEMPFTGQYIFVTYNGMMTRSLPPQVTAQKIACYLIEGVVTSLDNDHKAMQVESKDTGAVIVHLPELEVLPQVGDYAQVYFNGVMALSYPGQVNGMKVAIFHELQGEVKYIEESFFLMGSENGTVQVNLGQESQTPEGLATGREVTVYYNGIMTRSLPPQVFGMIIMMADAAS